MHHFKGYYLQTKKDPLVSQGGLVVLVDTHPPIVRYRMSAQPKPVHACGMPQSHPQ